MAEKKALQKELGGHEKGDFYSSSKRTPGVTGSKELRSSEGELESLITERLQSAYLGEGPISFNNPSSLGPQLSYASNFKVNAGGIGGESVNQRNRELNETKQFLRGIWEVTRKYKMADKEEGDNVGEFSSDFIVEVSSVLDKLKSKISKSKSKAEMQFSNTNESVSTEEEQDSGLVELIDKLQSSLGSVMLESKKQLHKDQKQSDAIIDKSTSEEDADADDEEESEDEIDGESQGESEDEEYETETVQTAILLKNENQQKSTSKRSSGVYLSSPSSTDSITKTMDKANGDCKNSGRNDKNNLNSSTPNSTSSPEVRKEMLNGKSSPHSSSASSVSPSSGLQRQSSRNEARSYLSSAIVKCRSREELVKQQSGEIDDYEDNEGTDENNEVFKEEKTESEHEEISEEKVVESSKDHEVVKKKNLKDLPWKIRAAKKRMEQACAKPAVPKPRFLYQTFNEAILNSKPRPYKPGGPAQSSSISNLHGESENWKPANYVGYFNRPINSKSSEAVFAPITPITQSLSADHINKPKVPVKPESDDSEDSDEEEGEVFSMMKPLQDKPALQKELPGIFHQQDKTKIIKPFNVLQKVDKKDVAKKSELFIKAAENAASNKYDQKPTNKIDKKKTPKSSRPTLSKVRQVPGHTYQPNAAVNNLYKNINEMVDKPSSSPTKRPTTLNLRYMVPDCRPSSDMFKLPNFDSPTPPIPVRGEVPRAPPVPGRPGFLPVSRSHDRDLNLYQPESRKEKFNKQNYRLSRSRSTPTSAMDSFTTPKAVIQAEIVKEKVSAVSVPPISVFKPVFTNEHVKTNMVSKLQSKFEGSVSENTDNCISYVNKKPLYKPFSNANTNKTAEKFSLENDPSKMLFTQEQLVKIAVHKAAINKQLSVGEQNRKSGVNRTYSLGSQDQQTSTKTNYHRFNSFENPNIVYNNISLKDPEEEDKQQQNIKNQEGSEQEGYQEVYLESEKAEMSTFNEPLYEQYQLHQEHAHLQVLEEHRFDKQNLEQENNEVVRVEQQKFDQQRIEQQWLENELNENELEKDGVKQGFLTNQQRMEQQKMKQQIMDIEEIEQQRIFEQQRIEQETIEQQRLEQQKLDLQRLEQQKLEQQRNEQQMLEKERLEQQRLEQQRLEQQRLEQQMLEQQRLEQQRLEQQRLEQQRLEQQRLEKQRLEQQRLEQQRLEQQRLEQQRLEQQRLEQQRLEQQRLEQQRLEQQRLEQQRLEQQRLEQQRLEQQRLEQQRLEQQRLEQQRLEQQRLEQQRLQQQKLQQQKLQQQKLEQQKLEQQRIEQQRMEKLKIEQQRITQQKLEEQRIEQEKIEKQKEKDIHDKQARLEIEIKQQQMFEQQKINEQNRLQSQKISFQPRNTEHKKLQEKFEPRNLRELVQHNSVENKSCSTERRSRSPTKKILSPQSSVEGAIGFVSSAITRKQSREDVLRRSLSTSGRTSSHGSQSSVGDHEYYVSNNEDPEDEVFNENSPLYASGCSAGKIVSPETQFTTKSFPPVASKNSVNTFNSEIFNRFPQVAENPARVSKPTTVHRANSLLDKDRRKSAFVIGSSSMASKSFDKQDGFFPDSRETFRAKSSSISTLSEHPPTILPASVPFNRAAQSLRNIKKDSEIQNLPISQVQTHLNQQNKWNSNPDSVNKAKAADFSVPPLPTTAMLQHKMQHHRENIPALNSPPIVNTSFPSQKVSKWGSVPESISKPKASDFYVPPLPKTDFNKLVNKNIKTTKALNNRAQSLTSLVSEGSASPPQQMSFRSGALEIITEKESEIQADKQGKVASMWESKVNDAHSKLISIDKPWKKGTAAEITGQFVKRNKDKLLKNVDVGDQPVKINLKKKFVAEITGQLVKVKGDKTNNKVKTNSTNKIISKGNSAIGTVKQITNQLLKHVNKDNNLNNHEVVPVKPSKAIVKQPKLKMFNNVVGTNAICSPKVKSLTKERIRTIEKLSTQESVSNVCNVVKNIEFKDLPNENNSISNVILRNKKTKGKLSTNDSRLQSINKAGREQMEMWHNQGNIYSMKAGEFKDRIIKSITIPHSTTWENSIKKREPEGPSFSSRVQKMNKEQVQSWLKTNDQQMVIPAFKGKVKKVKGESKIWNESVLHDEYATSSIPWKDNPKSAAIVKSEKAKFEAAELTSQLWEQPLVKGIRRSASSQIKSNIKAFEQQVVSEPFREPILHSGSMLVKKGVALFQEEVPSEPPQISFPIRSSKSAVFRKGAYESLLNTEQESEMSIQDKRRSWNEVSSQRVSSILEKLETIEHEVPARVPILHSGSMLVKKGVALFQDDTELEPKPNLLPLRSSKSAVFRKGTLDNFFDIGSPSHEMLVSEKRRSFIEIPSQKVSSILGQFEVRGSDNIIGSQCVSLNNPKRPQTLEFYPSTTVTNPHSLSSSQLLPWGKEPPKRISPSPTTPKSYHRRSQYEPTISLDSVDKKRKEIESFFSPSGADMSKIFDSKSKNKLNNVDNGDEESETWESLLTGSEYSDNMVDELFSETLLQGIDVNDDYLLPNDGRRRSLTEILYSTPPPSSDVKLRRSKTYKDSYRDFTNATVGDYLSASKVKQVRKFNVVNERIFNPAVGQFNNLVTSYDSDSDEESESSSSSSCEETFGDVVTNQKSNFSSSFSTSQNTSLRTTSDSKGASAFDKFKQLDAGQSRHSTSAKSGPALSGPLFQLSSSLKSSANSIKDIMLTWCQCRTRDYQGVKIENFSTSWNDGLAFCALIHHFYPDSFDFNSLNPNNRRHNFALAFRIADEKAGVYPLLDVDDMVMMQKPDWKSVFTYVQSLYKRLKDE